MLNFIKTNPQLSAFNPLNPIRHWLRQLEVRNAEFAHFICRMILAQYPFERNLT